MGNVLRSVLVAGVATVTVGASALSTAPAAEATHRQVAPASPAYLLTALPSPLPISRSAPIELGSLEPEVLELVGTTSINSAIKNVYNAVEPWVEWGFDVAEYVVGWIPIAGWFAPQITILYDFGEAIVQSIVFNIDDWLFGPLPFFQGVRNVISDTWDASWNLLWNEVDWLLPPLPPLPPIPPCPQWLCGPAVADTALALTAQSGVSEHPWESLVSMMRFQGEAAQDLAQSVGGALASFAQDLVKTGGQAVADLFEHGLITAVTKALGATWESIVVRSGEAIDGFAEYFDAQKNYFTAEPTPEVDETASESEESVVLATAADSSADDTVSSTAVDGKRSKLAAESPEDEQAVDPGSDLEESSEDAEPVRGRPGSERLDRVRGDKASENSATGDDVAAEQEQESSESPEETSEDADEPADQNAADQDDASDTQDAAGSKS